MELATSLEPWAKELQHAVNTAQPEAGGAVSRGGTRVIHSPTIDREAGLSVLRDLHRPSPLVATKLLPTHPAGT
jgi:hypothetical protein